jgi:hypothetical protein
MVTTPRKCLAIRLAALEVLMFRITELAIPGTTDAVRVVRVRDVTQAIAIALRTAGAGLTHSAPTLADVEEAGSAAIGIGKADGTVVAAAVAKPVPRFGAISGSVETRPVGTLLGRGSTI